VAGDEAALTGDVTPAARGCVLRGASQQVLSGDNPPSEQRRCSFGIGIGKACAARAFFNSLCAPDSAGEVVHALLRCDDGRTVDAVFSNASCCSVER
jgi:hypothetical protein